MISTSCPFSHDWAELAGVLDTGNTVTKGTGQEAIMSNILLDIYWGLGMAAIT